jgi:uncharacterized protein (DUF362 family)
LVIKEGKHRVYLNTIGENIDLTLLNALEYIDWGKYIQKKTRVFVKPNFTYPCYVQGVTTNPTFLKHLLALLRTKSDIVTLGESDGGNHSFTAEEAFNGHGMYDICRSLGVELINLSRLPSKMIESEILGKKVKVQLPKLLLEDIDCFISVPVFKIHVVTTTTLSLKNSWGCIPDTMRGLHHTNLSYKLALIAKAIKPKIIVIDGTYSLNKHGPMYGEAIKTNTVLVSDNVVAADSIGASIMGFNSQNIHHIVIAEKAGLGSMKSVDMEINQHWEPFQREFSISKTIVDRASSLLFYSDFLAKMVLQSPFKPLIYKIGTIFRTSKEKALANEINKHKS